MQQECLVQSGEAPQGFSELLQRHTFDNQPESAHGKGAENFADQGTTMWEDWYGGPSKGSANHRMKANMARAMESHGRACRETVLGERASHPPVGRTLVHSLGDGLTRAET